MIRILFVALLGLILMGNSDCSGGNTADERQREATAQAMDEATRQVGMPDIVNFTELKMARDILELRDDASLATYTYIVNWEGQKIFLGNSLGYGLPYSVQFTNPERCHEHAHGGDHTIQQPDPNGLFMPGGLSATWVLLVDPQTGEAVPVYVESEILVSPFKLH